MLDFNATLPPGWDISPRLMARWTFDDGSTIEVTASGGYFLTSSEGKVLHKGTDFSPGMGVTCWEDVLCAFISFMEHDAETYRHFMGPIPEEDRRLESDYLFGDEGAEWCYMHDDELSNLRSIMDPEGVR